MDTRRRRRGTGRGGAPTGAPPVFLQPPAPTLLATPVAPVGVSAQQSTPAAILLAQMPGSFASHAQPANLHDGTLNPEGAEDPSTVMRMTREMGSPNPFLSTATVHADEIPTVQPNTGLPSSFPQQLSRNSHLASTERAAPPFTPRLTVQTQNREMGAPYNSPEISGPANFGPSVSQQDLWEDHENLGSSPELPYQRPTRPSLPEEEEVANVLQGLDRISEEGLEYTDEHEPVGSGTSVTAASSPRRLAEPLNAGISQARSGILEYSPAVRDLVNVDQPIQGTINEENTVRYYYTFPTSTLRHEFQGTPSEYSQHYSRLLRCLALAGRFLRRDIEYDEGTQTFTRSGRIYVKDALQMLSALLHNLFRSNNGRIYCFKVDREIYMDLANELLRLRKDCEEDFVVIGCSLPRLPKWGRDGSLDHFWSANNFEILAASYRTEVENFLQVLLLVRTTIRRSHMDSPALSNNSRLIPELQRGSHVSPPVVPQDRQRSTPVLTVPQLDVEQRHPTPTPAEVLPTQGPATIPGGVTFAVPAPRTTRRPSNLHSTAFGLSAQTTSSNRLQAMFGQTPVRSVVQTRGGEGPPGPPDDSSDESSDTGRGNPRSPRPAQRQPSRRDSPHRTQRPETRTITMQPQFDTKLKVDLIPTWDGEVDTLARWIFKVNRLSERSAIIQKQLGVLVPTRLTGQAEQWYYSQSPEIRISIETDWATLRQAIGEYYMNEGYVKGLKSRANRARYRQRDHEKETPSQYFIRKLELLQLSYNYNDVELIHEIMSGVPESWMSVLSPKSHETVEDFRVTFKYYEDHLIRLDSQTRQWSNNNPYRTQVNDTNRIRNPFKPESKVVRSNAVGWSQSTAAPAFPKDDSNVSPRSTPEQKGGRACRHCGSMKHWDPECKYARKGERKARVSKVEIDVDDFQAQEEYDELYYGLDSGDEAVEDF